MGPIGPMGHILCVAALCARKSHQPNYYHPWHVPDAHPAEKNLQLGGPLPRLPLRLLLWQPYISNRDDHHGRSRELSALSSTPA